MMKNVLNKLESLRIAFVASIGFTVIFASTAFAQLPAPAVPAAPGVSTPTAEVERVVVTGSNNSHGGRDRAESSGYVTGRKISRNSVSGMPPTCRSSSRRRRAEP